MPFFIKMKYLNEYLFDFYSKRAFPLFTAKKEMNKIVHFSTEQSIFAFPF